MYVLRYSESYDNDDKKETNVEWVSADDPNYINILAKWFGFKNADLFKMVYKLQK